MVAREPELLSDATEQGLRVISELEGLAPTVAAALNLVREARSDHAEAWRTYETEMNRLNQIGAEVGDEIKAITALLEEKDFETVVVRASAVLPQARAAGQVIFVGALRSMRAKAYIYSRSEDRANNLERAIDDCRRALPITATEDARADVLMNAGIAYCERIRGDKAENIEQAIVLERQALSLVNPSSDQQLALIKSNLATALIRRQHGDRAASLSEAAQLCRESLAYRTPDRDIVEWAYAQLNLGTALDLLDGQDSGSWFSEATHALEAVVSAADRLDDWLVGAACHSLGRLHRRRAQPKITEDNLDVEIDRSLLERARDQFDAALPLVADGPEWLLHARVASDLSAILVDLDQDSERVLELAEEAYALVRPTTATEDCATIAARLAELLAANHDWTRAADVYRAAVEAAELTFHARLETSSRLGDIRRVGRLYRWAAFAIAAAGDTVEAALVLETGRTREFRRRLGLERREAAQLAQLEPQIAERYRAAAVEVGRSPVGGSAGRALQESLEEIRSVQGFEDFGGAARREDLLAAAEPGRPLIYVNPTPLGLSLLLVSAEPKLEVVAYFYPEPVALEVLWRLAIGDAAGDLSLVETQEPSSLVALITGDSDRPPQSDLEQVMPWLGEKIARPIAEIIDATNATGVTLISCGPIAIAPLHAARWGGAGDSDGRCLLDRFDVRFAQSALVAGVAVSRARNHGSDDPVLVALADTAQDLKAAVPETTEISRHFAEDKRFVASHSAADSRFLIENARRATHLHLACHGNANVMDAAEQKAVLLSDGWLGIDALAESVELAARLTVISACQSGVVTLDEQADESVSLASVMIGAGSACVVASLWPVDDLSTALLMAHMYEQLFLANGDPVQALRSAQLWLHNLTVAQEQGFLDKYPQLSAEFHRRRDSGDLPGERSRARDRSLRPYASEYYWAGFVAVGA